MAVQAKPEAPLRGYFFFFVVVVIVVAQATPITGQSEGFISIDCGGVGYKDRFSTIEYVPDTGYVDTGESRTVLRKNSNLYRLYENLRSFPEGIRNCYKLRSTRPGGRYLVRAYFYYGNYDGEDNIPVFDLHIGVNFWATVRSDVKEIITVAASNSLSVCLVNQGQGTPFISGLELRPLSDSMYVLANPSQSLILAQGRWNDGGNSLLRYPDDPYDRVWLNSSTGFTTLTTTQNVGRNASGDEFEVPTTVLRTAIELANISNNLNSYIRANDGKAGDRMYVFMHFAEIVQLMPNETRAMNIYQGADASGGLLYANYTAPYLQADTRVASGIVGEGATYNISVLSSATSTRPPAMNALESYLLRSMDVLPTDHGDVETMEEMQVFYKVTNKNWRGDPCAPTKLRWDGVNCDYGDSTRPPRVIGLSLGSNGLSGGIPASLVNLTALKTLDLSNNNLSGAIPDFLAELPSLELLILTGNQLTGPIPSHLCEKQRNRTLKIRIDGDPGACAQTETTKKRKSFALVAIIVAVSAVLVLFTVISIILWRIRSRRNSSASDHGVSGMQQSREAIEMNMTPNSSHAFTFVEIREMTNQFEKVIGKGGFGTVYLGHLNDGSSPPRTQMAVKVLSQLSSQGIKEFRAEAMLLTRVHHKNLVALFGYCHDENNLALVYEYMDMGSLHDHLSSKAGNLYGLSWEQRAKIAVHAAQGLEYLHNGCRPPIVHRDVKSSNILLNRDFTAKLADFGLSRFKEEDGTTTAVAGTPGYLDPEYYQTYRLSERSDVYSFGIVLLEIITGQPVLSSWPERRHITQWVESRMESGGGIERVVDDRLSGFSLHKHTPSPNRLQITFTAVAFTNERMIQDRESHLSLNWVFKIRRNFWSRVAGKYGNVFYWRDKGEDKSIEDAVVAISTCLRDPFGSNSCSEVL